MLCVVLRVRVISRKETSGSETVEHLTKIRRACQNIVVRVKGIDAKSIMNAQLDPALGHDLHQPERSAGRYGLRVAGALDQNDGTDPLLRDRKPA